MNGATILIILGALLTAVGVLGGGFEIKEIRVPRVGTVPRVLALAIGLALISGPAYRSFGPAEDRLGSPSSHESSSINWALTGQASQSSTDYGGEAKRAIDGDRNANWAAHSVTSTADKQDSWWQVELSEPIEVNGVILYNRADCCGRRLSNFHLTLMDASRQEVWGENFLEPVDQGGTKVIPVPGVKARIVRVALLGKNRDGNGYLSLAEVEVYGSRSQ